MNGEAILDRFPRDGRYVNFRSNSWWCSEFQEILTGNTHEADPRLGKLARLAEKVEYE
jgi:hypothetical protein